MCLSWKLHGAEGLASVGAGAGAAAQWPHRSLTLRRVYPVTLLAPPAGETSYLSNSHGGPHVYLNLEDHVTYATGRVNHAFQAAVAFLRTHPSCRARLHWWGWAGAGRAGGGAEA